MCCSFCLNHAFSGKYSESRLEATNKFLENYNLPLMSIASSYSLHILSDLNDPSLSSYLNINM